MALIWLSIYLAGSAAVLGASGHGWLAAAHVMAIGLSAWALPARSGPWQSVARVVGDLLPLFVAPLLYGEIPFLIAGLGTSYHDTTVQGWEHAVFGSQPARELAGRFPFQWLSELVHGGYLSYYVVIFAPSLLLFARRELRGLSETVLALTVTYTICWTIFALMPVEGPRYAWPPPAGVPDGPVRRVALGILAAGSSRGAAFPSSHMAVAVAMAVIGARWQRSGAWVLGAIALLIGVGAVYGGFHYALDVIAGAALGGGVAALVITRRWTRSPRSPSRPRAR